jgi:uncharacterized membrane protein
MELMMNKIILNEQDILKTNIVDLLDKLTIAYQNTRGDRQEIISQYKATEQEFSILEEIELITVDLRGYASQIKATGYIKNKSQAIEKLQVMRIFNVPSIAEFYFDAEQKYELMKEYIRILDYLRLLLLEYLHLAFGS